MALTKVGKEGITGISNASDANAITIDSSERVMIGTTTEGRADEGADIFTIEAPDGGHAGMTIRSGTSSYGSIYFSDGTSGASEYASSIQFNHSTNNLALGVGGSDHMRIREGGAITTGTSQPDLISSAALHQTSYSSANNWAFIYNDLRTGAGTSTIGKFYRNGSEVGSISSETNSVAYNTSSDHRLKENVDYTFDATTRLKQLKPARFNFIADADTTVDGFLAHEVQSVVPEAISGTHNEVDDDGNAVMQGIDQSKLVPLLVKTIQELEARITALENG